MLALRLIGPGASRVTEAPDPVPAEGEVLVRVESAGICGSDLHLFRRGRIGNDAVKYPFTPGHECTGRVEEISGKTKRIKAGDCVVVDPQLACGTCSQCLAGRPHTCLSGLFLGNPGQKSGCMSQKICVPEICCHPVPEETLTTMVFAEPVSIGIYALRLAGKIPESAAILGAGPIGLSVLHMLKRNQITSAVTEKVAARRKAALELGADWTGNPDSQDVVGDLFTLFPDGVECAFDCCGDPDALKQAVRMLKPGGTLMLIGIPEQPRISFDIGLLRRKEIRVQNVRRQNGCLPEAIDLLLQDAIPFSKLITPVPLEQSPAAFSRAASYKAGIIKTAIQPNFRIDR